MHVLLLSSYAPSLVNFRGPLIRDMLSRGHRVSVGAPDIAPELRAHLELMGAQVYDTPLERTGTRLNADLAYLTTLCRLIRRIRPDLVVTYTIKPNIWGALAAASFGIRSAAMVTGLGYLFTETGARSGPKLRLARLVGRWLYRASTRCNSLVIFQNADDRRDFIAAGCLGDPSKARLVNGSGVDLAHFTPAPLPDAPVFLMISRLLRTKGAEEYARAAMDVKKTHPQAEFHLVGFMDEGPDGVTHGEIDTWAAEGLRYLGPRDDVRPDLAACQVYVLPSYREGTPRSVLEAMATGRAILTSDAPGCRETVEDGVNGYLVPVRDVAALAARMRELIEHPDKVARMAEASLAIAREKYHVDRVNGLLIKYLGL